MSFKRERELEKERGRKESEWVLAAQKRKLGLIQQTFKSLLVADL